MISMSFLKNLKEVFSKNKNTGPSQEELGSYIQRSRDNLKQAGDYISRFLDGVRDFQPARRHQELFHAEVKNKLAIVKSGITKGVSYLDEKMGNSVNTMNTIRSVNQLSVLVSEWIVCLKKDDEKSQDLIKVVGIELWGEDRAKRGFPVPSNRDMLMSYLEGSLSMLREAKNNLETYNMSLTGSVSQEKLENLE